MGLQTVPAEMAFYRDLELLFRDFLRIFPESPYACAKRISREVDKEYCAMGAKKRAADDFSCHEAHCITNCRIKRECLGGGITASAASLFKELFLQPKAVKRWYEIKSVGHALGRLPFSRWDPQDSPSDMKANKKGRGVADCENVSCEEGCKGTRF